MKNSKCIVFFVFSEESELVEWWATVCSCLRRSSGVVSWPATIHLRILLFLSILQRSSVPLALVSRLGGESALARVEQHLLRVRWVALGRAHRGDQVGTVTITTFCQFASLRLLSQSLLQRKTLYALNDSLFTFLAGSGFH